VAGWEKAKNEGDKRAPPKRLSALANGYFKAAAQATGEKDGARRLELARDFHAGLLEALGYQRAPGLEPLEDGRVVPVVLTEPHQGKPWLWVLEAPFPADPDDASPLEEALSTAQLPDDAADATLVEETFAELFDNVLFRQTEAPRWVLLLAGSDAFLIDRNKWPQGKYLHFALGELFGRRDSKAMTAVAGLLHREVILPLAGQSLLERLDENSHKHAYAVSTKLKTSVQEAIEVLANEAVFYRRSVSKAKVFEDEALARDLTQDCITYLYRLLFLFYVEARGQELGVVPMGAESYRLGYSLETLRDLEQVALTTSESREGYFLHESLNRVFRIVQHGYPRERQRELALEGVGTDGFAVEPLRSQLFDDERLKVLGSVRLRNQALQKVLELLSLSREGSGQRGRISYAQLGINQLGAVYEGLLSYRGFFAQEDVVEIAGEGTSQKEVRQTYFVPVSRKQEVDEELIVKDARGRIVTHPKGTYLFRMAGRDREKSASYYTPEVLTECLVRYTLKERLEGLTADEILELTVCEPAMGSGAFLNAAIDQLADAYLQRKQVELGETIEGERYPVEKQKVKAHFAIHNCYGVDLNPLAAELGKVSLWLGTLYEGALAPFLDLRIAVGNSLIGARRAVFSAADLTRKASKKGGENWLTMEPQAVPLGQERPRDGVYHFLVPDAGMAPFDGDKVLKELAPENVAEVKGWRKGFCAPFTEMEVRRLLAISDRVDGLWEQHLSRRREAVERTRRRVGVWGQQETDGALPRPEDAQTLEEVAAAVFAKSQAGERLGRVMDYWCALWFWPLTESGKLPSREEWLGDLESLTAKGNQADEGRMAVVERVRERYRFFHWELRFAEVFADRGGMDVILGNPPWRKVEWQEGDVLADFDATLAVGKLSAKQWADRRARLLKEEGAREVYLSEAEEAAGTQSYLNSVQMYPLLRGVQTNLYKCFMTRAWEIGGAKGMVGLLHQPGVFDDPKGGTLRLGLARRLCLAARFKNELMLFPEVDHQRPYSFSITTAAPVNRIEGWTIANALHPRTIDESFAHDGIGPVPGIKTGEGQWDLRGHRSRLVPIDEETLAVFARLYDEPGTPALEARLPVVHSREILNVLRRFADAPSVAGQDGIKMVSEHLHESRQQADGTIRRDVRFPKNAQEWIVSGPHFYVGTPFNKTPNEGCKHNQDYAVLDLTQIPDVYLPRTNYVPACSPAEYRARTPHWRARPVTEYFRHVHRTMISPTGERTFIPALLPPGPGHVDLAFSICMERDADVAAMSGMFASLPVDFFVKTTGKSHARNELIAQLPLPTPGPLRDALIRRALRLNCLTTHYAPLWEELFDKSFPKDAPTKSDPRAGTYAHLTAQWQRDTPLRTSYSRRQALCEIDALAALSLGMTLDELLLIYRVQFPVLQQYERETFYDRRGKIVFTVNKGLTGVGLDRKQWEEIRDAQAGARLPEWARDQGGPFEPPFDCPDREADMAQAYEGFRGRLGIA
jgi:hypothetical protein